MIGCTVLTQTWFLPEGEWIAPPVGWAPNIVRGRTYDTDDPVGAPGE